MTVAAVRTAAPTTYYWTVSNSTSSTTGSYYSSLTGGQGLFIDRSLPVTIRDGQEAEVRLPDGAVLRVEQTGRYVLEDKDAKVIYRGNRIREFNKFLNASDLLEQFIGFLGQIGVRQGDALGVPVEVFINWLILKAAEADKVDAPPDVKVIGHPLLAAPRWGFRCRECSRFIPRRHVDAGMLFCGPEHAARAMRKIGDAP